jgi:hypothetical protein
MESMTCSHLPNVFTHHNFGERALTIILNQNSDFATTLNSNWLQNDKVTKHLLKAIFSVYNSYLQHRGRDTRFSTYV